MKRMAYLGSFQGNVAPANDAGTLLKAEARSTNIVPADGDQLAPELASGAAFESTVEVGEDGTFAEYGTIDFGGNNTLRFSQFARGNMAPSPDGRSAGAVDWKVDSGTGLFEGATGYITSNFNLGESGDLVDYQVVSLLLP